MFRQLWNVSVKAIFILLLQCCSIISRADNIGVDTALPATAPPASTLDNDAENMDSVSGDGDTGAITKISVQGPRYPAPSLPGQCGGMWWWQEHGGGGDGDQPAAAFYPSDTSLLIGLSAMWPARESVMWIHDMVSAWLLVAPIHYLTTQWISDQKSVNNSPDVIWWAPAETAGSRQC